MNALSKIFFLTGLEMKRLLRQSKPLLFLLALFFVLGNLFFLLHSQTNVPLKKFGLVVEDESVEVKTFLGNITDNRLKGILNFQKMERSEAEVAMSQGEILGYFHVGPGLFARLDEGQQQSLELFIADDRDPVSQFLVKYVDNLTQVLNEAQNAAMIYLAQMRSSDLPRSEIRQRFTAIQVEYVSAFLTRSSVFHNADPLDNYFGLDFLSYYYFSAILILGFLGAFAMAIPLREDLIRERLLRLKLCGTVPTEIYLAKIMAVTLPLSFFLLFMAGIHDLLLGGGRSALTFSSDILIGFIPLFGKVLLIGLLIACLSLTLLRYTARHPLFHGIYMGILFALFLLSGLILPLPALGAGFRIMMQINPLTFSHRLLSGSELSVGGIAVLCLTIIACLLLLYRKQ